MFFTPPEHCAEEIEGEDRPNHSHHDIELPFQVRLFLVRRDAEEKARAA